MYTNPGDCVAVPTDIDQAITLFEGSPIADRLGAEFAAGYVALARHEAGLAAERSADPDVVNDWERERYAAQS